MHTDARGYVYETFREGGRVCRRYVGCGHGAALSLQLDRLDRQRGAQVKERARAMEKHQQKLLDDIAAFSELTKAVMRSELEAGGYHQHKRGAWRRQRLNHSNGSQNDMAKTQTTKALLAPTGPDAAKPFDMETSILKASKGDKDAAAAVWQRCKEFPEVRAQLVSEWGDMARQSRLKLMEKMFPADEIAKTATRAKILDLTREICGPNPSPLETLLAERVASCWLSLAYFEMIYSQNMGELSLNQSSFQLKRIDGAHRRYLDSIKALATVRKLQLPNVQVNIGEKQVNIGTMNGNTTSGMDAPNGPRVMEA